MRCTLCQKHAVGCHRACVYRPEREETRSLLGADSGVPGIGKYVLPLVMGSLQQLKSVSFGDNTDAQITLIARRSVQRPGVRHWRRGADAEVSPPPPQGPLHASRPGHGCCGTNRLDLHL